VKLYELSAEYDRLSHLAENGEDVEAALAELSDALEVKAERIGYVLRNLAADEVSLDTEIERLRARRDRIARQRERLRNYVRVCMESTGITKVQCPAFSITLGEGQPHVVIDNVEALPAEYVRTRREPDKAAILRAFTELGECVPGARIERGRSLRFR
jgi:hypothetical protein